MNRSKNEFEMVADEMGTGSLRTALNGLSDESCYYAGELKNYLASLGIIASPGISGENDSIDADNNYPPAGAEDGDELRNICTHNEHTLVNAYTDLLEEPLPYQSLKDIMLYQLNALRNNFLKIRTLNTARFALY